MEIASAAVEQGRKGRMNIERMKTTVTEIRGIYSITSTKQNINKEGQAQRRDQVSRKDLATECLVISNTRKMIT